MAADHVFFSARTSDGSAGGAEFAADIWTVQVYGTWDGATVTFDCSVDGENWEPIADAEFTEDGSVNIELAPRCSIRATVSDADASTSLTAVGCRKNKIGVL